MFPEFVATAKEIREAGRWTALNKRIEELAAQPGPGNGWYVQIFAQLCAQVFSEYLALVRAYEDVEHGEPSLLAWRARNLFELAIWSIYLAKGKDNARRLYEDAGRDAHELLGAYEEWGKLQKEAPDWLEKLADGKADLEKRAARDGVASLEERYMRVDAAAAECGLTEPYRVNSKLLSKFVHPTALQILGISDDDRIAKQRDCFFGLGCLFFGGAFSALEGLEIMRLSLPR